MQNSTACFAAERVQLKNGFFLDCDHREPAAGGRVRLILDRTNNIEVDAEAIRSVESMPVLASSAAETHSSFSATTSQTASSATQAELIVAAGERRNINVDLLQSVIDAESGGRAHAVSRAGAQGLMQLMPSTARTLGVQDSFDLEDNLRGGTVYLDRLLTRYHNDLVLALAAYNAGPGAVDRYHGVPPYRETVAYVRRIVHEFNRRTLLQQQSQRSKALLAESLRTR